MSDQTDDEIKERRRVFRDFIRRGLVVMHEDNPDGSADFTFTQPDHPEVVAFNLRMMN